MNDFLGHSEVAKKFTRNTELCVPAIESKSYVWRALPLVSNWSHGSRKQNSKTSKRILNERMNPRIPCQSLLNSAGSFWLRLIWTRTSTFCNFSGSSQWAWLTSSFKKLPRQEVKSHIAWLAPPISTNLVDLDAISGSWDLLSASNRPQVQLWCLSNKSSPLSVIKPYPEEHYTLVYSKLLHGLKAHWL